MTLEDLPLIPRKPFAPPSLSITEVSADDVDEAFESAAAPPAITADALKTHDAAPVNGIVADTQIGESPEDRADDAAGPATQAMSPETDDSPGSTATANAEPITESSPDVVSDGSAPIPATSEADDKTADPSISAVESSAVEPSAAAVESTAETESDSSSKKAGKRGRRRRRRSKRKE